MGNAGDLLKHGVLAEFVRWQRGLGIPLRFMDPFGGEPWGRPVPEVERRVRATDRLREALGTLARRAEEATRSPDRRTLRQPPRRLGFRSPCSRVTARAAGTSRPASSPRAGRAAHPTILVDVRLDAVAKAGNEGLQQPGAEDDLRSSPTSGSGASTVHDLVTNDAQVSEQVVQRCRDLGALGVGDSSIQLPQLPPNSFPELLLPLFGAPHLPTFLPEAWIGLAQFKNAPDFCSPPVQDIRQLRSIVTRELVVELLSLLPVFEPRTSIVVLVRGLVRDPIEHESDVIVRRCLRQLDPRVHAFDAAFIAFAEPVVSGAQGSALQSWRQCR